MAVDWWLWELYNSAAEPLPDHPKPKKAVKTSSVSLGCVLETEWQARWPARGSDEFQPEDLGIGRVHPPYEGILAPGNGNVGDHASRAEHELSAWTVASQRPSIGLPVRYLQHTTLHSL